MNKDSVQKRKLALEENYNKLAAELNKIQGAILDCDFWMANLEAEEKAVKESKPAMELVNSGS